MTIAEALALLEVSLPITKGELKKAYRHALIVWHPDRFQGTPELLEKATNKTRAINEAFEFLGRHTSAAESQKQTPPPFQREPKPEEKQKPEPERSKTEHTRAAPQGGDAVTKTTGPSFWQWLLCLIACLPAFYLAKLGIQAARGRQQAAAHSERVPSLPQSPQSPPNQSLPSTRVASCSFPSQAPSIQLSLTLPGSWLERQIQQSDTALKFADPSLTEFVLVRFRAVSNTELPNVTEWSKHLGVLSNGTQLPERLCTAVLPDGSRFVSAVKATTDWQPSVIAVWEKESDHAGERVVVRSMTSYFYLNGYMVAIEFMVPGQVPSQLMIGGQVPQVSLEILRNRFAQAEPQFERILSSAVVSTLKTAKVTSTDAYGRPWPLTQSNVSPMASQSGAPTPQIRQAPIPSIAPQTSSPEEERRLISDLRGRKYSVPLSQYEELVSLRAEAVRESKKPRGITPELKQEQANLATEEQRLNRAIKGKNDPFVIQWIHNFHAKKANLEGRMREATAPFNPDSTPFHRKLEHVGTKLQK